MRRFGIITLAVMTLFASCIYTKELPADQPNVLFIAIDDLNDWIGCMGGHPQSLTPNMDRLAARGVLFTNAHCAATACNPSRAAVFSGQMPWKTGVWSNNSKKLMAQHPDKLVLTRALKKAGYVTLGTGKLLHGGSSSSGIMDEYNDVQQRWSPLAKDDSEYNSKELPSKRTDDPRHVVTVNGKEIVLPLNRMPSDRKPNGKSGESFDWGPFDVSDSQMGDGKITEWAISKLKTGFGNKPFFMGVGFYRPHIPLFAPQSYFRRFADQEIQLPHVHKNDLSDLSKPAKKWAIEAITAGSHATVVEHEQWSEAVKAYLACVTFVDHQVGRLLSALDDSKHAENTLIILWSDHGWHLGEKQHWGKWTGWERSTRVPLMITPPRNQSDLFRCAGKRCDAPVGLIDLYPTIVDLCNVPKPSGLDGRSLSPFLFAPNKSSDRIVVTTFDKGNVSLRNKRFRYLRYKEGPEELYDLQSDPNEWSNLIDDPDHSHTVKQMRARAMSLN